MTGRAVENPARVAAAARRGGAPPGHVPACSGRRSVVSVIGGGGGGGGREHTRPVCRQSAAPVFRLLRCRTCQLRPSDGRAAPARGGACRSVVSNQKRRPRDSLAATAGRRQWLVPPRLLVGPCVNSAVLVIALMCSGATRYHIRPRAGSPGQAAR